MVKRRNVLAVLVALAFCLPMPGVWRPTSLAQTGPIKLSHDLGAAGIVNSYSISPDNRLVAYCGRDSAGLGGLWIAPIDGSTAAGRVPGVSGCVPATHWIGSDGATLMVGSIEPDQLSSSEVPTLVETTAPFASRPLFSLPAGYSGYRQIHWSADGRWIFFGASQDRVARWSVFVVPVAGGQAARQLTPDTTFGQMGVWDFEVTRDLTRLITLTDELVPNTAELLSRTLPVDLIAGPVGAPVRLNGPLVADGNVGFYASGSNTRLSFELTPNQQRVLYFADQDVDEEHALYSAPVDGGAAAVRLSPVLGADEDFFWIWPLNDQYAWYMVRSSVTYRTAIYRAPIHGPLSTTSLIADNGNNFGFWPVAGGARAVIAGSHFVNNVAESMLRVGPMAGAPSELIALSLPTTSGLSSISPDGNTLVYGYNAPLHRLDLRSETLTFVPLSGTSGYPFLLSNHRVAFMIGARLYSRALYDDAAANVLLSGGLTLDDASATSFMITPDDQWVTFFAPSASVPPKKELYSTGLGSTAPTPTATPTATMSPTSTPSPATSTPPLQYVYLPALVRQP